MIVALLLVPAAFFLGHAFVKLVDGGEREATTPTTGSDSLPDVEEFKRELRGGYAIHCGAPSRLRYEGDVLVDQDGNAVETKPLRPLPTNVPSNGVQVRS